MNNFEELNLDGLVGPTHNYSGLSYGNVASLSNQKQISNPKEAALQGLEKMKFLADLGIKQGVLPPHERPHLPTLRLLGFVGSDAEILETALKKAPEILEACSSAAAMWAANAATVIPSVDCVDQHVHFIPANLTTHFHRSIEVPTTQKVLRSIFSDPIYFTHHAPLPAGPVFADEGAANHTRFCRMEGGPGIHLFVFGRHGLQTDALTTKNFPARQTAEAAQSLTRLSTLYPQRAFLAQQNPQAIDAGVFHNDVITVGHRNVFLYHEQALLGMDEIINTLQKIFHELCDRPLICIPITTHEMPLEDVVNSYLFNSQIISLKDGRMALIAPVECQNIPTATHAIEKILNDEANPINQVHYMSLRQSMQNGGGPACLRLRIPLTAKELQAMQSGVFLTDRLYNKLKAWIGKHYRDRLEPKDLGDPALLTEGHEALDELTKILGLGPLYSFQRSP